MTHPSLHVPRADGHQTPGGTQPSSPVADTDREPQDVEQGLASVVSDNGDDNIVGWDGDDDPENPYNWSSGKKFVNCGLVSCLTLLAPLASSAFAPGTPQLLQDFGSTNTELSAFVLSVYVLGYAVGPMLAAPMSEMYGRCIVYLTTNIGFVAFLVGCALAPSMDAFIVFRFFSGALGSCVLANGGGTIADMIEPAKRGRVMAAFSVIPLIGPIIGPVAGGFLVESSGWRWVFWFLTIVAGFVTINMALFMRESYAPVLLERKARRLRQATGNPLLRSKLDTGLTPIQLFARSIIRPCRILFCSPLVLVFSVYMVVIHGYLYLLFASVSVVFQDTYKFSTSTSGLVFLSIGLGSITSLVWHSMTSDGEAAERAKDDHFEPEFRLKLLPYGAFCIPVGFFIYGWTTYYKTHWIAPLIGLYFFGLGKH